MWEISLKNMDNSYIDFTEEDYKRMIEVLDNCVELKDGFPYAKIPPHELLNAANMIQTLSNALKESLKLQAHYAELLNMHDGGKRHIFKSVEEWIDRLEEVDKNERCSSNRKK
jgi:hypothetical protein